MRAIEASTSCGASKMILTCLRASWRSLKIAGSKTNSPEIHVTLMGGTIWVLYMSSGACNMRDK